MRLEEFDFALPPSLIAQTTPARGASRLMVVDRAARSWSERVIADLPALLAPRDLVVFNDTKVFPARLLGVRDPSGGAVECLLIERVDEHHWEALVHPGQKLKPGARVVFAGTGASGSVTLRGEILERRFFGRRLVRLEADGAASMDDALDRVGHVPLPPYIHRPDTDADRERYQTIYARVRGSIAAPTAGLHFDEALLAALDRRGIARTAITHHVGYGTFKPVRTDIVEEHRVDRERYDIPAAAAAAIAEAVARGGRVVAVGTTTTRALESAASAGAGAVQPGSATTDLFIYPGHRFQIVGGLLTNFHLPRSSLLMLVAAFGGRELILDAYRAAVSREFRFYSYGDAMLIL
jgi:S-adenosylmethionine:tRNA ribosyltransferase-isomerase